MGLGGEIKSPFFRSCLRIIVNYNLVYLMQRACENERKEI
jgi:hypothetical protein